MHDTITRDETTPSQYAIDWLVPAWIASIALVLWLTFFNGGVVRQDEWLTLTADRFGKDSWKTHYVNYRYVVSAIGWLVKWAGGTYFALMPVWIALFVGGLATCSHVFCRFTGLPHRYAPFLFLGVALHGFMADIYAFPMAYVNYGISWLACAWCLVSLRNKGALPSVTAVLAAVTVIMCYQPLTAIILFAVALREVMEALSGRDRSARDVFSSLAKAFVVIVLSIGIFLVVKSLLGPENGRPVALGSFANNLPAYLLAVVRPFLGDYGVVFPRQERLLYGLALACLGGILAWRIRKRRPIDLIAPVLLAGAILLSPGPFNLFGIVFWPTPRSMVSTTFLHVSALLFVIHHVMARIRWKREALAALCVAGACLVGLSIYNQVRLTLSTAEQYRHDVALADRIVADLVAEGLDDNSIVAIGSDWKSGSQMTDNFFMDLGLSAFSAPLSRVDILRMRSGVYFKTILDVPDDYCADRTGDYHVGTVEGVLAVCIP